MLKISSYVTFYGNCREALYFYEKVFAPAETQMTTFKDIMPKMGMNVPEEAGELIFRGDLIIRRDKNVFMITFCDSPSLLFSSLDQKSSNKDNISFFIQSDDKNWLLNVYNELIDGGKQNIRIRENEKGMIEGSLIDKYGICWIFGSIE